MTKLRVERYCDVKKTANCFFEDLYFMWDSSIGIPVITTGGNVYHEMYPKLDLSEGVSINTKRTILGIELAKTDPMAEQFSSNPEEYLVVPVPYTSIPMAEGYAKFLGLEWSEAIRRKSVGLDAGRVFITKEFERNERLGRKFSYIKEKILGRKLIVIDDSIVRGDTSRYQVEVLKGLEAEEVHLRSACPPIRFPCFYGIDFPTLTELIASEAETTEEAEEIVRNRRGADSVHYQRMSGLIRAIKGFDLREDESGLCLACLNGNYPTKFGEKRMKELLEHS